MDFEIKVEFQYHRKTETAKMSRKRLAKCSDKHILELWENWTNKFEQISFNGSKYINYSLLTYSKVKTSIFSGTRDATTKQ